MTRAAHRPSRLAWFYHRLAGERRLGVFDPADSGAGSGRFLDRGPLLHELDELAALADGRMQDREWLQRNAEPLATPVFDIPVARPGKILCLGKNYAAHAAEFGAAVPEEPIFFTKFAETMIPHGAPIVLPHWVETRIDHEVELGVILGFPDPQARGAKYVDPDRAMELVAGFTIVNDVTARRIQGDDRDRKQPWLRSKSFDTFCPIGPWVIPAAALPEFGELSVQLRVNDELRQNSNTRLMVYDIPHAIAYLSRHTTLRPGDILATGTPEGVGPLHDGDSVTCSIEHLGVLQNTVVREPAPNR